MKGKNGMKILVTIPFTAEQKEKIRTAAGSMDVTFLSEREVTEEMLVDADILWGNLSLNLVQKASKLKWLQLNSAGADSYCKPGILKEETILTNASGAYDVSVSEEMVAATLAMFKKLYHYYDNQKQQLWRDEGMVQSAYGACIVVLGLGNIGLSYARKMKAMGSYIIGVKRHAGVVPEGVDEVCTLEQLGECLKRADLVVSVLPGTAETAYLMGKEEFAAMKKTAYFMNVGRGNLVESRALYEALEQEEIAGAMLDVTEIEPLPTDHYLWSAKNLYITPHVAGGYHIPVTLEVIADICVKNLKHYLEGEPLEHVVNRALGY